MDIKVEPNDRERFYQSKEEVENTPRLKLGFLKLNRRQISIAVTVCAVLGFVSIIWYAYNQGKQAGNSGNVPVIEETGEQAKVKPENAGGMEIPFQDSSVYNTMNPSENSAVADNGLTVDNTSSSSIPEESSAVNQVDTGMKSAVSQTQSVVPEKVVVKSAVAVAPEKNAVKKSSAPIGDAGKAVYLQLGAVGSEAKAKSEWTRLSKKYAKDLKGLSLYVEKADLGKKGIFYRIKAGKVRDHATAEALCKSINKIEAGRCMIK